MTSARCESLRSLHQGLPTIADSSSRPNFTIEPTNPGKACGAGREV
ncbi:MAG: hypothetical protein K2L93_03415 [Muribaculaceae bacterium]|nr:hypothetical protein [Muribaculaceae bacterium]